MGYARWLVVVPVVRGDDSGGVVGVLVGRTVGSWKRERSEVGNYFEN